MIGIYKITSPSNRVYIGQSVDIEKRFIDYRKSLKKQQRRIYNSIKTYGYENHIFEIIEECSIELLNERERFWQDHYDVLGRKGLNCRLTKSDDKTGKLSEETIEKLKNKDFSYMVGNNFRKGILHDEKTKNRIKETLIFNSKKPNYVNAMTGCFGDKNPFFNKKHSPASIEKMKLKPNSRMVLDTATGIYFNSIKEASIAYNINYSTLKDNLTNRRGTKNKTNLKIV